MKRMKIAMFIYFSVLFSCLLMTGCPTDSITGNEPDITYGDPQGNLLILQAYGNAGDTPPGGLSHSFVELYNISDTPINLSGIGLYFANGKRGSGHTEDEPWERISLSGIIPARGSFLILGAKYNYLSDAELSVTRCHLSDSGEDTDIRNDSLSLSRRGFKVAIIKSTAALTVQNPFNSDDGPNGVPVAGYIDMVGAVNSPNNVDPDLRDNIFGYEGNWTRCSAVSAVRRTDLEDQNDNSLDFVRARYSYEVDGFTEDEIKLYKPRNSKIGSYTPNFENPDISGVDYAGLKINEVSGVGADEEKFYELINTGTGDIPLYNCKIYYRANDNVDQSFPPLGEPKLTWTGRATQVIEGGGKFILMGRGKPGSFSTGLTNNRMLQIILVGPNGTLADPLDWCNRAADTHPYAFTNRSFSRIPDGAGEKGGPFYFTWPTPGESNGNSTAGLTQVPSEKPTSVPPESETLMILQANTFGNDNGGNAGFYRSLVELYNNSDSDIDLGAGNYYLHYGNSDSSGKFAWGDSSVNQSGAPIKLNGIIPSKCSYLVIDNSPAVPGTNTPANDAYGRKYPLPEADQNAEFILGNTGFTIAILIGHSTSLAVSVNPFTGGLNGDPVDGYVDMLGARSASNTLSKIHCEGTFADQSRPQSPRRISLTDTNENSVDFKRADFRGTTGGNGIQDDVLYKFWPRNSKMGEWNPISGLPRIDPADPD